MTEADVGPYTAAAIASLAWREPVRFEDTGRWARGRILAAPVASDPPPQLDDDAMPLDWARELGRDELRALLEPR